MSGEEPAPQMAPVESPQMISTVKLPMLKKGEYTLWSMRIEQYVTNTNYGLWQVIMNGDEPVQTTKDENCVETEVPPKTAQALLQRQKERKAKSILLLAIPDEYQLSNVKSKKMQKTILKQQFKNFSVSDTEALDKAYDRFQKLISQLEVHGGIDELNIDDLYNNLKVFEADIKGSSGSSSNSQNVAFLSREDTNSIHEVNTANGVSTTAGHSSQGQASSSSYTNDLMVSKEKVNTVRINSVNTAGQRAVYTIKGNGVTVVKASAGNLQQALKYKGMFDNRCSRHMIGNKALLTDYQDIDGGFVSFSGSTRGVKITVTDDFSRFSWVFFLATKSETSRSLKKFITEIENQLNHKVKVIRSDIGTKFKNREMDEFCGQKGIKREYCVARTPQQNRVTERKNMTLIEAARTMLADSLLPIVFWAELVNTACYVLNRDLVTKPHNKTPYELIIGRAPSISFMRPFGCPVTILNTLDPLGKFDGKAKEGFLVRYSVNSKAFRVFNTETRKVEENLHVNFLENKPNVAGQGPNWIFDIDSLTNSMNYKPVSAGSQTNKNAGPQETNGNTGLKKTINVRQTEEENVSTQQYIVFPLWSSIYSSYKSSDDKAKDYTVDNDACRKTIQEPASEYDQALKNVLDKMIDQAKEATEQSDAVRKEFEAQCDSQEKITRASYNTPKFHRSGTNSLGVKS
ncbi:putative ribonuclease H-like domain-containing protein [Tanacetum coccineum]